ncbi:MAG: FKBP-type peptidyl-prolyl cis-trans isomerase [Bacteroidales bacterium]|nr:FKBP-type peptidyl-prolyl cis-trans isomerase [Bacteroidales bacterium]
MTKVKKGDTLLMHYTGYRSDETIFDSTVARGPIRVQLGKELLIPGLEKALIGMEQGAIKRIEVEAKDAYGEVNPDLIIKVDIDELLEYTDLTVGQTIVLSQDDDSYIELVVIGIEEDVVLLDGNHELAGEKLTFNVEILEIEPKK